MFSYGICEIFKNTHFKEHMQTTASEVFAKIVAEKVVEMLELLLLMFY